MGARKTHDRRLGSRDPQKIRIFPNPTHKITPPHEQSFWRGCFGFNFGFKFEIPGFPNFPPLPENATARFESPNQNVGCFCLQALNIASLSSVAGSLLKRLWNGTVWSQAHERSLISGKRLQ